MRKIKTSAGINKYQWDYQEFCFLVFLLSKAKNFKEVMNVFIDLHTHKEISEITRRLIIASMLVEGKTYSDIKVLTGATDLTISKISQKFYRNKSVLSDLLSRVGSFTDYIKEKNKTEQRDWLTKIIDRQIYNRSLGIFGKK